MSASAEAIFDARFISSALNQEISGALAAERVTTDSRAVKAGDLFAAIKGEKFDGHDFVAMAREKGAVGAIVEKTFRPKAEEKLTESVVANNAVMPPTQQFTLIAVDNVTEALRQLAKAHRARLSIPVVAVAGSNGKTTTKELTAFLLRELHGEAAIFKTEKSQNSILGIALSLLQIRKEEIAVIEIGIDEPGWMDQHLDVVAPTHGLITTIAEEHLNRLSSLEKVAEEELKLLKYLAERGAVFAANLDSPWIANAVRELTPNNTFSYGFDERAAIEGRFVAPATLHAFGLKWVNPLPGRHNAQNLLAALTLVASLRALDSPTLNQLRETLPRFRGEPHRSLWLHFESDIQVYDDCYNANPDSMEKALQTFQELSDGCIQRLIVGDMLDLGEATASAHQKILNRIAVLGADSIYLLGPHFEAALKQMMRPPREIRSFSDHQSLQAALMADLKPADALFFKGSRGMQLERILSALNLSLA